MTDTTRPEWMPIFLAPRSNGSVWLGYYETGLRAQAAAQPVAGGPVMSEELEMILSYVEKNLETRRNYMQACARIRAQAAAAGKVELPKVRAYLESQTSANSHSGWLGALAELDAYEGKVGG